jgi:gliding motility-associated-like protein
MHIYDRWGNLLFNSSEFPPQNTQGAWGGTAKGLPVSEGTYVYRLVLETRSKKIIRKTGTITLVR